MGVHALGDDCYRRASGAKGLAQQLRLVTGDADPAIDRQTRARGAQKAQPGWGEDLVNVDHMAEASLAHHCPDQSHRQAPGFAGRVDDAASGQRVTQA